MNENNQLIFVPDVWSQGSSEGEALQQQGDEPVGGVHHLHGGEHNT